MSLRLLLSFHEFYGFWDLYFVHDGNANAFISSYIHTHIEKEEKKKIHRELIAYNFNSSFKDMAIQQSECV